MNIPDVILLVVEAMNNYIKDLVVVEILDNGMSRKYSDSFRPLGYLGVTILVKCNNKQHSVFLVYQEAENMLMYPNMVDGFLGQIIREDLENIIKKSERKKKLKNLI